MHSPYGARLSYQTITVCPIHGNLADEKFGCQMHIANKLISHRKLYEILIYFISIVNYKFFPLCGPQTRRRLVSRLLLELRAYARLYWVHC